MKRSEMLKQIKAIIRANNHTVHEFNLGDISFGIMAERLAKAILEHVEDIGMVPPPKSLDQLNEIRAEYRASDGCVMTWREEDGYAVDTRSLWDKE
jgi:hypothetical protein